MKNVFICSNCGIENPFFALNCINCKAYLRTRVVNIDLWQFIGKIIESPVKGFSNIIHAEHKNFVLILTFLIGIKYFINSIIFSQTINLHELASENLLANLLVCEIYFIVFIFLFSLIIKLLNGALGLKTRFRDNYAIYIFSLIPHLFALIFLVPVEYALFGKYWFLFNPPPYIVKPLTAYIILLTEGIMIIWGVLLVVFANYAYTRNKWYSIMVGMIFSIVLFLIMIFLPLFPFNS